MTDNEITELSAQAIGLTLSKYPTDNGARFIIGGGGYWWPLKNDVGTVRLLAELKMHIAAHEGTVYSRDCKIAVDIEPCEFGEASALRRAVATVAALVAQQSTQGASE